MEETGTGTGGVEEKEEEAGEELRLHSDLAPKKKR
jgi:hypothetical protein